jgi:TM2 domain-containing membrane protein YozV
MVPSTDMSDKRILPAFLLCFFFGVFGVHRFYAGKIGTGILELVTIGGFGIWWLVDLILILTGSLKDGDGRRITEWT